MILCSNNHFFFRSSGLLIYFCLILASSIHSQFTNVTKTAGIDHDHSNVQLMGGGSVFADFNNDGWLDLFLTGGTQHDKLFINVNGEYFEKASFPLPENAFPDTRKSGVVAGDFDNDGWVDLFVTTLDKHTSCFLLKNNRDNTFSNVSLGANILEKGPSISAALIDFNSDGLLDIYVINYIDEARFIRDSIGAIIGYEHECANNYLYVNQGDFKFLERAEELNVVGEGCALAVADSRFLDNLPGVYIANDFGEWVKPNELFVYDSADTTFVERSVEYGLDAALYGMGIAIGDCDNDLDFDLYVTNIGKNAFLVNENNAYVDQALEYNIDNTFGIKDSLLATGWGALLFDVENDADMDLFVANGYITSSRFIPTTFLDTNRFYLNIDQQFHDFSRQYGLDSDGINRGCIYGDYDNDGDLDLLVTTVRQEGASEDSRLKYQLYRNDISALNYLDIQLQGVTNTRQGFGSRIYIFHDGNAYAQFVYSGGTHASQNSSIVHFGVGKSVVVDSIIIKWPNDLEDRYYSISANQRILIEEGKVNYDILGCTDPGATNYSPGATINSGCSYATTKLDELKLSSASLKIYPVPVSELMTLVVDQLDYSNENYYIRIMDNLGRQVAWQKIIGKETQLDINALHMQSGWYVLQFYSQEGLQRVLPFAVVK